MVYPRFQDRSLKRKTAHSCQAAETSVPPHDLRGQTLDRWEAGAMDRMGRSKLYFNHISIRDWTRDSD